MATNNSFTGIFLLQFYPELGEGPAKWPGNKAGVRQSYPTWAEALAGAELLVAAGLAEPSQVHVQWGCNRRPAFPEAHVTCPGTLVA